MIQVDLSHILQSGTASELERLSAPLERAHAALRDKTGAGAEFTGWLTLPRDYDGEEFQRVRDAADKIRSDSDALVVIGIGGSYLGARAAVDLLRSPYYNLKRKSTPDIFFTGNTLSGETLEAVLELVKDRDFSVNVISKSGTTTEPAVAFRLFKGLLERKYGAAGAKSRIYATTDARRGALKRMAEENGYARFTVPDDIGGRYSVLTSVGLLPMAVTGIDVSRVMEGAADAMNALSAGGMENPAWRYAAGRNLLYRKGKRIEILACYEPAFRFMGEWWKQLFGESEGKNGLGLFPASVEYTADLHSMGQYIQDGERLLFETVLQFAASRSSLSVPPDEGDGDGLNYLAGKGLDFINAQAAAGTLLAHADGGAPGILLTAPAMDETSFGELVYFFELACGLSGYLLGVNPFDQPGVEAYKRNMFALLGKPGYETEREALLRRIHG